MQRICLATASPKKPTEWERHGPIVELGARGAFDERSATYPRVHRIGKKWHLYYSGRSTREGTYHFPNYWGSGLAQSNDLRTWQKYSANPVLLADGVREYPECAALVGLGNIIELSQPDGRRIYRMYYTLLPGLADPNWKANDTWHVIEHKVCIAAHSVDGIDWRDRRLVLDRRRNVATEDIGVVGLNVWKSSTQFRGIYTGLATKYKSYAMAEASSVDGLIWNCSDDHDNVSLIGKPGSWDSSMIGYPCVLPEENRVRLFYNGAGGGTTGIGMAVARDTRRDF